MVCAAGRRRLHPQGTPEDWEKVRAKAGQLKEYDLDWWLEGLLPALDEFVQAAHGRPNLDFWRSLCNAYGASGIRRPMTGWVQVRASSMPV